MVGERKIIQILIDEDNYLIALCDDGTVWFYRHGEWQLYAKQIPQDRY